MPSEIHTLALSLQSMCRDIGFIEGRDATEEELVDMWANADTLAAELSAKVLPDDARERVAKWLAYRTASFMSIGWDKMFHIEQDHFLAQADDLLAALTKATES